jgi:hypothetical protein
MLPQALVTFIGLKKILNVLNIFFNVEELKKT